MSFNSKSKTFLGIILAVIFVVSLANPANAAIESPRKQIENGTLAEKIICKTNFSLVIRNNGSPICVTPETAEKFERRMLGKIEVKAFEVIVHQSEEIQIKDLNKGTIEGSKAEIRDSKEIQMIPASAGSIINFYITDDDLNLSHNGVETVSTKGLFEFSINGFLINGPTSMIETGPNTGQFYVKLQLPETINGRPLNQNDVVSIKYFDASDSTGDRQTISKSVPLTNNYAKIEKVGGGSRIGHEFTLRIYEPDANFDSRENDKISLSRLEYRGEGGIRTTLANPSFDANSSYFIETGENTNTFEVKIKIPRKIDGKTVGIGDWYEIRYIDGSTPSGTNEKIVLKGKIG